MLRLVGTRESSWGVLGCLGLGRRVNEEPYELCDVFNELCGEIGRKVGVHSGCPRVTK